MPGEPTIVCPVHQVADVTPCPPEELEPLLDHLHANRAVVEPLVFPRGTLLPDGRLDLCKQSLGVGGCRAVTHALRDNRIVRSLLLGTDGIGDEGAGDVADLIAGNPAMEVAYLGCNRIGLAGVERLCAAALHPDANLRGLWLKRNPVGNAGAAALADLLRRDTKLRVLDLVNTGIDASGLIEIVRALQTENRTLERLYLGGNAVDSAVATELARVLRTHPALRSLQLGVSPLGDDGAECLADGLRGNRTLDALGVASCGIGERGAAALLNALASHPRLTDFDLGASASARALNGSENSLGDAGAATVATYLAKNPPLQRLSLTGAGIGGPGRITLMQAMTANTHLLTLRLDGRPEPRIVARLQQNRDRATGNIPVPDAFSDVALIRSVYRTSR